MLVIKSFTFNPIGENMYLVYNESKDCAIIDPGCYFPEEREILRGYIEENQLNPILLLNTHCHLDHVFGNKFVYETWGLELHLHANEQQVLKMAPVSGEMYGMPFENYDGPLHFLYEGTTVKIGADELQLRFTPGHSPGSLSFYSEKDGFVISGDALFQGSIGRTDLPGGNFEVLIQSIKEELYTLPDDTLVFSGHGEPTTIGAEKRSNPFVKG